MLSNIFFIIIFKKSLISNSTNLSHNIMLKWIWLLCTFLFECIKIYCVYICLFIRACFKAFVPKVTLTVIFSPVRPSGPCRMCRWMDGTSCRLRRGGLLRCMAVTLVWARLPSPKQGLGCRGRKDRCCFGGWQRVRLPDVVSVGGYTGAAAKSTTYHWKRRPSRSSVRLPGCPGSGRFQDRSQIWPDYRSADLPGSAGGRGYHRVSASKN